MNFNTLKNFPKILLVIFLVIFIFQMLIFLFLILSPLFAQAQASRTGPAYDPTCWKQDLCQSCGLTQGCYWEQSSACADPSNEWGRCYAGAEPIKLSVQIPGVTEKSLGEVKDIAEYIAALYKYTVGIGGILATVMVIVGGIIYLTAGGNPSRITQAKEYIGNALIGAVLLFTSYLLLQTLNPDLVKLQMPRIFLIKKIVVGPETCPLSDPKYKKMAEAGPAKGPYKTLDKIKLSDFTMERPGACDGAYYSTPDDINVCYGTKCDPQHFPNCQEGKPCICVPLTKEKETEKNKFGCTGARLGGSLKSNPNNYARFINLKAVCEKGGKYYFRCISSLSTKNSILWGFTDEDAKKVGSDCNPEKLGFYLEIEMKGSARGIFAGKLRADLFYAGKNVCGNAGKPSRYDQNTTVWFGAEPCLFVSDQEIDAKMFNSWLAVSWSQNEILNSSGVQCDLDVTGW